MHINKKVLTVIETVISVALVAIIIKNYWVELGLLFNPSHANQAKLLTLVHRHGIVDVLLLMLLIAILCGVPGAPNSVVCIFTGVCYGPLFGFLISWCGDILGNCLVRVAIAKSKISTKTRKNRVYRYLLRQRYPVLGLATAFAVPFIPNLVTNYASLRLQIRKRHYLVAVALGTLPVTLIYAYSGHAISAFKFKRLIPVVIIFILLCCLYFTIKFGVKRYRSRRMED